MSRLCESENKKYANLHYGFRAKFWRICGSYDHSGSRVLFRFWARILVVWKFGSWISTSHRKAHFLFLICLCHAMKKMTRTSNALTRDRSVMADLDLVDFLRGSTDSAINFSGSADLHTPIHPSQSYYWKARKNKNRTENKIFPRHILKCGILHVKSFRQQSIDFVVSDICRERYGLKTTIRLMITISKVEN